METVTLFTGSNFFIIVLSGLILGLAFQLLLTNLSFAAGLQLLKPSPSEDELYLHSEKQPAPSASETAVRISSGFGIWTLVTSSIALFAATFFSSHLGFVSNPMLGGVLGLVIWGLFYLITMALEAKMAGSLVGSLVSLIRAGFRSAYHTGGQFFTNPEDKAVASELTQAVHDEFLSPADAGRISEELSDIFRQQQSGRFGAKDKFRSLLQREAPAHSTEYGLKTQFHDTALPFDEILEDIRGFYQNPKDRFESLTERLRSIDRHSMSQALAERGVAEEESENLIQRFENTKAKLIEKSHRLKSEVDRRLSEAKEHTLRRAEEARQVATVAAWWFFATALFSGAASALGGYVAAVQMF